MCAKRPELAQVLLSKNFNFIFGEAKD
jgi:hypothetical protein